MSPGSSIGPYQVVRELGRGAMGTVYEVHHPASPGRSLALKQLKLEAANAENLLRFQREAEVLGHIEHPGVVRVHDQGRGVGGVYFVTELIEGRSLQEVLREGPLPPRQAAGIVRELADALGAVHAAGVLHRDLKPDNVILRPDGRPVLIDFGVARTGGQRLTQTGTLLGTPLYMAPEQAMGESSRDLDVRTDVYGLGAILLALLSGRPPYEARTLLELLQALGGSEPAWPASVREEVPRQLDAICRRAMAREREARYPDAGALRAALDAWLGPPGDTAPPAIARSARPRRGMVAVVAGGFGLGALALLLLLVAPPPPPPGPEPSASPGTPGPSPAPSPTPAPLQLDWLNRLPELAELPPGPPRLRAYRLALRWWLAQPAHPRRDEVAGWLAQMRERPLLRVPAFGLAEHARRASYGQAVWIDGELHQLVSVEAEGVRASAVLVRSPLSLDAPRHHPFSTLTSFEPADRVGGGRFASDELLVHYTTARPELELWSLGGAAVERRHTWHTGEEPWPEGIRDAWVHRDAQGRPRGVAFVARRRELYWAELPPPAAERSPARLLARIPADAELLPAVVGKSLLSVAVSPDGRRVACGGVWRDIFLVDRDAGGVVATLRGHREPILDLCFLPDGSGLLSGGGKNARLGISGDYALRLFPLPAGSGGSMRWERSSRLNRIACAPDGRFIAVGTANHMVGIFARSGGQLLPATDLSAPDLPLAGVISKAHAGSVQGLRFAPQDPRRLYSISCDADPARSELRVWDLGSDGRSVRHLRRQELRQRAESLDIAPDGSCLLIAGPGSVELWGAGDPRQP